MAAGVEEGVAVGFFLSNPPESIETGGGVRSGSGVKTADGLGMTMGVALASTPPGADPAVAISDSRVFESGTGDFEQAETSANTNAKTSLFINISSRWLQALPGSSSTMIQKGFPAEINGSLASRSRPNLLSCMKRYS